MNETDDLIGFRVAASHIEWNLMRFQFKNSVELRNFYS